MNKKVVKSITTIPLGNDRFSILFKYQATQQKPYNFLNLLTARYSNSFGYAPIDAVKLQDCLDSKDVEEHFTLSGMNYFDLVALRQSIDDFLTGHGKNEDATKTTMEIKQDD